MKFAELLDKTNTPKMKVSTFVDDDPYKEYDNIIEAYHHIKKFWPKQVEGIAFCDEKLTKMGITSNGKPSHVENYLQQLYRMYANGNMTVDAFNKVTSLRLENGGTTTLYQYALDNGDSFAITAMTNQFVNEFNKLARQVKK